MKQFYEENQRYLIEYWSDWFNFLDALVQLNNKDKPLKVKEVLESFLHNRTTCNWTSDIKIWRKNVIVLWTQVLLFLSESLIPAVFDVCVFDLPCDYIYLFVLVCVCWLRSAFRRVCELIHRFSTEVHGLFSQLNNSDDSYNLNNLYLRYN